MMMMLTTNQLTHLTRTDIETLKPSDPLASGGGRSHIMIMDWRLMAAACSAQGGPKAGRPYPI